MTYNDLLANQLQFSPHLQATVSRIDLNLSTKFNNVNTAFLPSISANFELEWPFAATDPDLTGSQPTVIFSQIGTNWAETVGNFLGPSFGKFLTFLCTGPVGDILTFLGQPLPVISTLVGSPTNIIDFATYIAAVTKHPVGAAAIDAFFTALQGICNLYNSLPGAFDPRYRLMIDQGDIVITDDVRKLKDIKQAGFDAPRDSTLLPLIDQVNAYETKPRNRNFTTEKDGGVISGKMVGLLRLGLQNASISLPLFQDPGQAKYLLLGNTVDLLDVTLPNLNFLVNAVLKIPIDDIPLSITLAGKFDVGLQFGFGFDTLGFQEASAPGGSASDVRDGFFINTKTSNLDFNTKLFLGLDFSIPDVVSVGVEGGFIWDDKVGLVDPDKDGKLRLNEADKIINQDGFLSLFNNSGSLSVGGDVYFTILGLFTKYIQIYHPTVLFQYGNKTAAPPTLGSMEDGVLHLNMGPDAFYRHLGDDGDESFTIRHVGGTASDEDLEVSAFGVTQVYHDVRKIVADGGAGNDTIDVAPGVLADADLSGGAGDDRLSYRGSGQATLRGGSGNDDLEANGPGTSRVFADGGDDTIVGGPGATLFASGASSYTLADGRLTVGASTIVLADVRRVVLKGTDKDDSFIVGGWSGDATIDGVNGFDALTFAFGGGGTVTFQHSGPVGRGRVSVLGDAAGGVYTVSATRTSRGAEAVNYDRRLDALTVDGGPGPDTFNLLGEVDGSTLIRGGDGDDTFNIASTDPFTYTQIDAGAGDDSALLGVSGLPAVGAVPMVFQGGLTIGGAAGRNVLSADIPGNLQALLEIVGYDQTSSIYVRGDLLRTVLAPDSATIGRLVIDGSLADTGEVAAGNIGDLAIGRDLQGNVQVAGTLGRLSTGGALAGTVAAANIGDIAIGGDLTGAVQAAGTLSRLSAGGAMTGTVAAANVGDMAIGSDLSGTVQVAGNLDRLSTGGAMSGSMTAANVGDMVIDGDLRGTVQVADTLYHLSAGGALAGTVAAANVGDVTIGGDLRGTVLVAGTLNHLSAGGATPGTITAGDIGTVSASASIGPVVLQINEAGVWRRVLATPADPTRLSVDGVRFAYYYDSTSPGAPQLALRVINGNPLTPRDDVPFDLALVTDTAAGFDLARLDAAGHAGLRNLLVEGDLLRAASPAALSFLGLPPGSPGGIRLPEDHLGAVAIRGNAAAGSIRAASLQALSFGSVTARRGRTIPAGRANGRVASLLLAIGTRIQKVRNNFHVPVRPGQPAALFLATRRNGRFNPRKVLLLADGQDNTSTTAAVTVAVRRRRSAIRSIEFLGAGGSVRTRLPIGPAGARFVRAAHAGGGASRALAHHPAPARPAREGPAHRVEAPGRSHAAALDALLRARRYRARVAA